MSSTENYPEHDRTSCRDDNPNINATAEGSTGCARCTAMLLDRDARTRELLEQFLKRVGGVSCSDAVHGNDNVYVHAPQLVEELLTLHDLYEGDDNE